MNNATVPQTSRMFRFVPEYWSVAKNYLSWNREQNFSEIILYQYKARSTIVGISV